MYRYTLTITLFLFINSATSVLFCNKTDVVSVENSTSVCVNSTTTYFAKCCPLNYAYNTKTHSCRKVEKNRFDHYELFYKIGLRNCLNALIVDFITNFENLKFFQNGSVALLKSGEYFNNGRYCLDEVFNTDLVVIRYCDSDGLMECGRNRRCLRKCCPDLEIFVKGSHCKPMAEQVFNYQNWSKAKYLVESI